MEPFIGQIVGWAPNFAPRGWALCQGQLLAISQNDALFSLLGTIYGGDGRTTFGLPDLRSRVAVGAGQGPGLSNRPLGAKLGTENETLTVSNLPNHDHGFASDPTLEVLATSIDGNQAVPDPARRLGAAKFQFGQDVNLYNGAAPDTTLDGLNVTGGGGSGASGGSQTHANVQPYQTLNYIIALVGVYPSRN